MSKSFGGSPVPGSGRLPPSPLDAEFEGAADPESGTSGPQNGGNDDDDDEGQASATLSDRLMGTIKVIRDMSRAALPTRRAAEAVQKSPGPSTTRFQRKREAMYDVSLAPPVPPLFHPLLE